MIMRLYGAFTKAEVQSDGTVRVEGIASSEAEDDQGETVRADAMRLAIPDYMRFPALREMHQLSAAGTTLEADVGHDGVTRIVGHIIDPVAISKIKNRVYRGFSIGGQVTGRDPTNRKIITGLKLNEISLVDRPANPEAIFDIWKAGGAIIEGNTDMPDGGLATLGEVLAAKASAGEPVQIWSCSNAEHRHLAKADAVRCLEDEAAMAAESPAEGATALEGEPGSDAATEVENAIPAPPAEPQSALDMVRAAIERGEAALARAGANTEPAEPAELSVDRQSVDHVDHVGQAAEPAAKGGDQPGDGSKPYGDETYADPGYQADGKKRYPVTKDGKPSEERIRAAWTYISKPANCAKYSGGDCGKVKAKIVSAWKEHIDSAGPPSASEKASLPSMRKSIWDWLMDRRDRAASAISGVVEKLFGHAESPVPRHEIAKALWDVGQVAGIILALDELKERLEYEALVEGDGSPQPAKISGIIGELCDFLNALVAEETAEILDDEEMEEPLGMDMDDMGPVAMSAVAASLRKHFADDTIRAEALVMTLEKAGAHLEAADQVHLDYAAHYALEAMEMDGVTKSEMMAFADVYKVLIDTGATSVAAPAASRPPRNATQDTSRNAQVAPLQPPDGAVPASPMPKASDITRLHNAIAKASELPEDGAVQLNADLAMKAGRKPQHIMAGMIHDCLKALSSGTTCDDETEVSTQTKKVSGRTMAAIHKAHEHIGKVPGGECPGGEPTPAGEEERQGASSSAGKTVETDDLAKAQTERDEARTQLVVAEAEKTAMASALTTLNAMVERMAKRVDDIYNQPVAPIGIVRTGTPTTKAADNAPSSIGLPPTQDEVAAALGAMSKEEQTLTMIKASYATPMALPASVVGHSQAARDRVPNR